MATMADFFEMRKAVWNSNGYFILENAVPEHVMSNYERRWLSNFADSTGTIQNWQGWDLDEYMPYIDTPEILDIMCGEKMYNVISSVVDETCALHLNFTSWQSTKRAWHRDMIDESKKFAAGYIGAYVALEEAHDDAGPFQYVPGSHLWNLSLEEMGDNQILNRKIHDEGHEVKTFKGKRGDVIFWHGHLVHQGSMPKNNEMSRKALLGHYASQKTSKYEGMHENCKRWNAGWYYDFTESMHFKGYEK
jgi:hypothetical protein